MASDIVHPDPAFKAGRDTGKSKGRKSSATGRSGGSSALSQKCHDESAAKNQYKKPVVCLKAPYARID